jgi:hypothetical protein
MNMPNDTPSITQLQRALKIAEQIDQLEQELRSLLGASAGEAIAALSQTRGRGGRPGKRQVSSATRDKMAAPARARHQRKNGNQAGTAAKPPKGEQKRVVSPEVRARLAAAMKARWDAAKKKGGPGPNARKG